MEDLPAEIIQVIAKMASDSRADRLNLLLLCKTWYFALIPTLWFHVDVTHHDWDRFKSLFSRPKKLYQDYRKYVHEMYYFHYRNEHVKLAGMRNVLQGCTNLTQLYLDTPSLNDDDLWVLTTSCKALQKISILSNGRTTYGCITDEGLSTIAKNASNLQHLIIKSMSLDVFSERGLLALANGFKSKLLSFGLEYVEYTEKLVNRFEGMHNTSYVGQSTAETAEFKTKFVDSLIEILNCNPQLEKLLIDWPFDLQRVIKFGSEHLTKLTALKVGNMSSTDDLAILLQRNKQLVHLSLFEFKIKDLDVDGLLKPIAMGGNSRIRFLEIIGVCHFVNIVSTIPLFTRLESIVFTPQTRYASLNPFCPPMTDIPVSCPLLKKVVLPIHDNNTLLEFANHCPLIEHLEVQDGRAITNEAILIMSTKLKLKTLALGFCTAYDSAIEGLVKYQSKTLVDLTMPTPSKITLKGFQAITTGFPNLVKLSNLSCDIPFETLCNGINRMKKLQDLHLGIPRGQPPLSRDEVERLKNGTKLRYLNFSQ